MIVTFFYYSARIDYKHLQTALFLFNPVEGMAGLVSESERHEKIMSKDKKVAQSHYPLLLVINYEMTNYLCRMFHFGCRSC